MVFFAQNITIDFSHGNDTTRGEKNEVLNREKNGTNGTTLFTNTVGARERNVLLIRSFVIKSRFPPFTHRRESTRRLNTVPTIFNSEIQKNSTLGVL